MPVSNGGGREPRPFFTTESLARYLSLSPRYVRDLLNSGELPSYYFGRARRIDPADVDSWLCRRRQRSAV
ncbi:MAG TPA: helix-turn-helix domain-containing protein [Solirubrobacterales bacterium]|nr:helix-turn-helix domain-containing protein [Solirubrobacterales bacterium]